MLQSINEFIDKERGRFTNRHDNLLAMCFGQIIRYHNFLAIILNDYQRTGVEFASIMHRQSEIARKSVQGPVNPEHLALMESSAVISNKLHLQIESFYLFSKILLDKAARALEFYFGSERSTPLDSHDDAEKNLEKFASKKHLSSVPAELKKLITLLKQSISDYRDYEISHEKSPRTVKGTLFSGDGKGTKIFSSRIFPTERDLQKESEALDGLMERINHYLGEITAYISANNDKTALELKTE